MRGVAAQRIVRTIRKPRNKADEAIAPKPEGMGLSGRSALSRRSPMGACHGLRVASCSSSRKAAVAATRDLFRGSLMDNAGRVLVTGATGFVGSAIVRAFLDAGYPVRTFVRAASPRSNLAGLEIESVDGDICDNNAVARAMAG